jgi:hypothetical protein
VALMSDDQTYGGSSKVAATFHGADGERAELLAEIARQGRAVTVLSVTVDRLTGTLNRVRALAEDDIVRPHANPYQTGARALAKRIIAALDGPAPADPDKAQP